MNRYLEKIAQTYDRDYYGGMVAAGAVGAATAGAYPANEYLRTVDKIPEHKMHVNAWQQASDRAKEMISSLRKKAGPPVYDSDSPRYLDREKTLRLMDQWSDEKYMVDMHLSDHKRKLEDVISKALNYKRLAVGMGVAGGLAGAGLYHYKGPHTQGNKHE